MTNTPPPLSDEQDRIVGLLARAHAAHRCRVTGALAECRCGEWSNVTESDTHAAHVALHQAVALRAAQVIPPGTSGTGGEPS